ncbi:MAG: NAD(P)H-dependent oxidoreductase subunit E [Anaerolineae bacterium]|nr:NAD(P)H-dependent oxidoreductase subunit E [Anaerolineae bacterium]
MNPKLAKFAADIRQGRASHASLFWLRVFVQYARQGALRSDEWVALGLREAALIAGLNAADLAPRMALLADYDLFQAVRLKDQQLFIGSELADLDWSRKYELSLQADVSDDGAAGEWDCTEVADCVEQLWREVGPLSPQDVALEKLLSEGSPLWGGNGTGRSVLLEVLHEAQALFGGWLPRHVVTRISRALHVPLSDVYGVTEFYTMFYTQPVGKKIIRLCEDGPCAIHGAEKVKTALCQHLQIQPGQTTPDGEYTLEAVRCLGLCDHAPAALVNTTRHFHVTPNRIHALLNNAPRHGQQETNIGGLVKIAMANVKVVDPTSLSEYRAQGGLAALRRVLQEMTPTEVIEAIKASKLVGRGGAAFPAGTKWQFAANNPPGPRYVICNADESEVGAFKDRAMMDFDPFRVVEGLMIACYAIGAAQGYIYVRGEHRLGYERFAHVVVELERAGWLGDNIQGSGFACRIAVRRGAGAYICGEETALIESIEGKRGFPRLRPPFPANVGLWGRPTVINNVETLGKVPSIIVHGGNWYNLLGTQDSAGTKLFAVSGSVVRPGVYEVPFGVPLRHLIYDLAGGLYEGRTLQGILTGGAAGTFLKPEHLDTPVTFEDFKQVGGTIGAGTMMVFDDTVDLADMLTRVAEFFAHESCGKCYPCQMGTQRQAEILHRLQHGHGQPGDVATLLELGRVMTDTSICGLGQSANWAVADALKRWPGLFGVKVEG